MMPFRLLPVLALFACSNGTAQTPVKSNDARIRYTGRVAFSDSAAQLSWSATSVKVNFTGTGLKALLKDEKGLNTYNVIIDGHITQKLELDSTKKLYTLAAGLPAGNHQLELFRRTEWEFGKTWLYELQPAAQTTLLKAPAAAKRKIEFFGNSITCAYAVEDTSGKDRGTAPYENAWLSYATITARHFGADAHLTARSGIGILVSWSPIIMPEIYDRTDPTDPQSRWNFSSYTPDVVVINLFQNDSWLVNLPNHEQFKARFNGQKPGEAQIVAAYAAFVKKIRSHYPKATIICALGNMDITRKGSPWPGYVEKAVASLNDKRMHTCFFPYKDSPGHPSVNEQQAMADKLIAFIGAKMGW
ncbi:GDSL-type esterase/lipase family protein [Chitinophaga horti]|uniref:GDSL-type esterase/lipase family protein n=1 Tax=Chitinophaga horti TaxID=2920382 RepID=A0ABY6J4C0_9BACT|nr:SGNH/GDSL hydrolase family protein [Chitinophaga horti]UYQ94519.1 GDSL-type esterase/lipase family protein [Chitinophaga horti]